MPTLVITRGLPASGKSTYARKWVAESPTTRANVTRDDLRDMMHGGVWLGQDTERQIKVARDAAITALLKRGVDVICSDTNLPSRTARDLRRLATLTGAEFDVVDMTDVPLDVCIERDAAREKPIGEAVIRDMHTRYVAGRKHPLPIADEPAEVATLAPYVRPEGTPKVILCDLDGTVALMGTRSPFDETRVHEDRPNEPVIAAVRAMWRRGHQVIFMSGRTDACREATEDWLAEHVLRPGLYEALHMRKAGDTRKDSVVKAELFDRYVRDQYNVIAVFDDRASVVAMWRSLGLTVFQVAPGEF